jgi:hypothetical protein
MTCTIACSNTNEFKFIYPKGFPSCGRLRNALLVYMGGRKGLITTNRSGCNKGRFLKLHEAPKGK